MRQRMLKEEFNRILNEQFKFEGEVRLSEGNGHAGLAYVTRWVGRRI